MNTIWIVLGVILLALVVLGGLALARRAKKKREEDYDDVYPMW